MEFSVYYGGLPKVVHGLRVAVESRTHGPHVPACDLKSWSLLLSSWMFAWSWVLQPACRFCLSSMHPMKQTGCGGVVPYCLGAARIEAGGNYPVESENSSHRREQPLASCSSPNELGLITGRLLLSVLCLRWCSEDGVASPCMPGQVIWGFWSAQSPESPSRRCWQGPTERRAGTVGVSVAAGAAGRCRSA